MKERRRTAKKLIEDEDQAPRPNFFTLFINGWKLFFFFSRDANQMLWLAKRKLRWSSEERVYAKVNLKNSRWRWKSFCKKSKLRAHWKSSTHLLNTFISCGCFLYLTWTRYENNVFWVNKWKEGLLYLQQQIGADSERLVEPERKKGHLTLWQPRRALHSPTGHFSIYQLLGSSCCTG